MSGSKAYVFPNGEIGQSFADVLAWDGTKVVSNNPIIQTFNTGGLTLMQIGVSVYRWDGTDFTQVLYRAVSTYSSTYPFVFSTNQGGVFLSVFEYV